MAGTTEAEGEGAVTKAPLEPIGEADVNNASAEGEAEAKAEALANGLADSSVSDNGAAEGWLTPGIKPIEYAAYPPPPKISKMTTVLTTGTTGKPPPVGKGGKLGGATGPGIGLA